MYYWFTTFWVNELKYEYYLWADSYDDAKYKIKLAYGSSASIKTLERIN